MSVCLCVSSQACPWLSVLIAAPTKQTETASASLHAWNPARPDHAWLLRCADACEYNNGALTGALTHAEPKSLTHMWRQRTCRLHTNYVGLQFRMFSVTFKVIYRSLCEPLGLEYRLLL